MNRKNNEELICYSYMEKQIKNFIITDERLGRGSSATVYLGYHKTKKIKVAVKKFEFNASDTKVMRRAKREIDLLQRLSHPNIIKLYDVYNDTKKNDIYLFLEYCPRGSMKTFLGKGGYIEEIHVHKLVKQMVSALKYLIHSGIYHRDIKPQNLLLSKNFNLKISDFGLATMNMKGTFKKLCGSPLYMAPEILLSGSYNKKSDLWSIGIVIFEFLFGHHPFGNMRNFSDLVKYVKDGVNIKLPPERKPKDVGVSENCLDLLERLLVVDPEKRMSWEDFFHHSWIKIEDDSKLGIDDVNTINEEKVEKVDKNICLENIENIFSETYDSLEDDENTEITNKKIIINVFDNHYYEISDNLDRLFLSDPRFTLKSLNTPKEKNHKKCNSSRGVRKKYVK